MAARRLIVVMLVLLGLSTIVAALLPPPDRSENVPGQGRRRGETAQPEPSGNSGSAAARGLIRARITTSRRAPEVVRVTPGQRLVLLVGGPVGDDISIPAFGLTETATPSAPARFDLIVDRPGRFAVRAFGAERDVGRIVSKG